MSPMLCRQLQTVLLAILTVIAGVSNLDIHHILCPRACNCYAENTTTPELPILHFVCRWNNLNSYTLSDVAEYDPIYTLRIQCPHGSVQKSNPADDLFDRLKNLEHIAIHRCKIGSLNKNLFKNQIRLSSLKITSAALTHLSSDLFEYIPNIRYLDFSDNNLNIVPFPIAKLVNLEYLILSRNWIQFLTSGLSTLTHLRHLILDGNNLTNLDLSQIPASVDTLRLRANQLKAIHYDRNPNRSLRFLDLANNHLEYLASVGDINRLPSMLSVVYLTGNRIATIQNGSFAHMQNLTDVDLRNNRLQEFTQDIFDGTDTHFTVKLSGNPLKCTCSLKWILENPTTVNFGDFDAITCEQMFQEKQKVLLKTAHRNGDLLCNYEVTCPQDCACCLKPVCSCFSRCPRGCTCWHSAMPYLTNSGQNIVECKKFRTDRVNELPTMATEICLSDTTSKGWSPAILGRKHRLKTLNLTNAGITEVSEDLIKKNFPALQHLDLSNNLIKNFPADKIYSVTNLQTLLLNNNRLTNFTIGALKRMEYYKLLKIGGESNLYSCDCERPSDLQIWLHKQGNKQKVHDYENIYCKVKDDRIVQMMYMDPEHPKTLCVPSATSSSLLTNTDSELSDHHLFEHFRAQQRVTEKPESTTYFGGHHRGDNVYNHGVPTTTKRPVVITDSSSGSKFDLERSIMITIALFLAIILLIFLLIAVALVAYFRYNYLDGRLPPKKGPVKTVTRLGTSGTLL